MPQAAEIGKCATRQQKAVWEVGDDVEVQFEEDDSDEEDDEWRVATVSAAHSDGTVDVTYADDGKTEKMAPSRLRAKQVGMPRPPHPRGTSHACALECTYRCTVCGWVGRRCRW